MTREIPPLEEGKKTELMINSIFVDVVTIGFLPRDRLITWGSNGLSTESARKGFDPELELLRMCSVRFLVSSKEKAGFFRRLGK